MSAAELTAAQINRDMPGSALRFDGMQPMYEESDQFQWTPWDGPAVRRTFYTERCDIESVRAALCGKIELCKVAEETTQ
ncbi:hypothetical protein LCGC14_0845500 [marine sediment metagenome]|uniref:Uncharacterized protein n=1 Tax=marine sediment metagenome TaxID=412755 RepID=A0A0F9PGP3_9ZZZZ